MAFLKKNKKKFHLHVKNLLSKNFHLEKISPDLFNQLKKSEETISDTGIYLDKEIFGLKNTLIICAKTYDAYTLKNSLDEKDVLEIKSQFAHMNIRCIGK